MRALNELPRTVAAGMHTVFSDIDDTLTTDGQLVPQAYVALDTLRRAGLRVILITGRPAGWCDHIARMWPVDAVIGENGAFYYWHDPVERKLQCRHLLDTMARQTNTERLAAVRDTILREVLPNISAPLIAEFGLRFCFVFLTISALSFLGLGLPPPLADWGAMVRDNAALITFGDSTPLLPAACIAVLTVSVNFVVDWMLHRASGLKD